MNKKYLCSQEKLLCELKSYCLWFDFRNKKEIISWISRKLYFIEYYSKTTKSLSRYQYYACQVSSQTNKIARSYHPLKLIRHEWNCLEANDGVFLPSLPTRCVLFTNSWRPHHNILNKYLYSEMKVIKREMFYTSISKSIIDNRLP